MFEQTLLGRLDDAQGSDLQERGPAAALPRGAAFRLSAGELPDAGRVPRLLVVAPPAARAVDRQAGGVVARPRHLPGQQARGGAARGARPRLQVHRQPVAGRRPQVRPAPLRGRDVLRPASHLPLPSRPGPLRRRQVHGAQRQPRQPVHPPLQLQHQQVPRRFRRVRSLTLLLS